MPNIIRVYPEINVYKLDVDNEINIPTYGNLVNKITDQDQKISDEKSQRESSDLSLDQKISDEKSQRENALSALQSQVDANYSSLLSDIQMEGILRSSGDSALDQKISDEKTERENSDVLLQSAINNETIARQIADTALDQKISDEKSQRESSDSGLQTQIDNLSATISSGVHWKASVSNLSTLQTLYASDEVGTVRLVRDQKDAFIKVEAGQGENIEGLTGEAYNSYVRFIDSVEVAAGISALEQKINEEKAARETAVWQVDSRVSSYDRNKISSIVYNQNESYLTRLEDICWGLTEHQINLSLFVTNNGNTTNVIMDNGVNVRVTNGTNIYKFIRFQNVWYHY